MAGGWSVPPRSVVAAATSKASSGSVLAGSTTNCITRPVVAPFTGTPAGKGVLALFFSSQLPE